MRKSTLIAALLVFAVLAVGAGALTVVDIPPPEGRVERVIANGGLGN
jgi:hypothetical protein